MTNTFLTIAVIGLAFLAGQHYSHAVPEPTYPTCSIIKPDRKPLRGDEIIEWLDSWGAFSMSLEELQRFDIEGI
jgi:hypothetical protein